MILRAKRVNCWPNVAKSAAKSRWALQQFKGEWKWEKIVEEATGSTRNRREKGTERRRRRKGKSFMWNTSEQSCVNIKRTSGQIKTKTKRRRQEKNWAYTYMIKTKMHDKMGFMLVNNFTLVYVSDVLFYFPRGFGDRRVARWRVEFSTALQIGLKYVACRSK